MQEQTAVKKEKIHKADIVLIAACLLSAFILAVMLRRGMTAGNTVKISYDGEAVYTAALKQSGEQYYLITYTEGGIVQECMDERPPLPEDVSYNLLRLADGNVSIEAADCKDQICVRHKPISGVRENIICLPHRLVVQIAGVSGGTDELDGIAE